VITVQKSVHFHRKSLPVTQLTGITDATRYY